MPYFIDTQDGKYCVRKGTEESPGETLKCYDERFDAVGYMRALYANAEDASEKATIAEENISGNLMHGEGGILNPGRNQGKTCTCPKCGATKESEPGTSCSEVECPECGVPMTRKETDFPSSDEKAVLDNKEQPEYNTEQDQSVRSEEPDLEQKQTSTFTSYKAGDQWRWHAVSNVAIKDRENEIITEKAYDDAISYAQKSGDFGTLDLVHVDGTDIGDCDSMTRVGPLLIEGGTWRDTPLAERVRQRVAQMDEAVSIMFKYDRDQFDGVRYNGGIQILKRTILPRNMAASYGTAIVVSGGNEMEKSIGEKAREALLSYNVFEEEIAALESKQIDDPDVKQKRQSLIDKLVEALTGKAKVPPKKPFEEEEEDEEDEDEEEKPGKPKPKPSPKKAKVPPKKPPDDEEEDEEDEEEEKPKPRPGKPKKEISAPDAGVDEVVKALTPIVSQVVAETLAPIQSALSDLNAWKREIEAGVAEGKKEVEQKANEILAQAPPIVKAPVTMTAAAIVKERLRSGVDPQVAQLVGDIQKAVTAVAKSRGFEV